MFMQPVPMQPVSVILIRVDWDRTAIQLGRLPGRWHTLHLGPEPGYPFGRKGLALISAWTQIQMANEAGIVILDGDVAIDPVDYRAMMRAITAEPSAVHVAPARLWPKSTQWAGWTWAHHRGEPSQEDCADPTVFSFCFTYLPRRLLDACRQAGMAKWAFPVCDSKVTEVAVRMKIPVRVVAGASPKHLHY
jgi:hypothetical protein